MILLKNTQVVRIGLSGLTCPSKERLLELRLSEVPGIRAASLGGDSVLTTLIDTRALDVDRLVAAIVEAGLVPEGVLEPAAHAYAPGGDDVR